MKPSNKLNILFKLSEIMSQQQEQGAGTWFSELLCYLKLSTFLQNLMEQAEKQSSVPAQEQKQSECSWEESRYWI